MNPYLIKSARPSYYNVKDYGAVGDGVADDAAAINRTIQAIRDTAATVSSTAIYKAILEFPTAEYYCGSGINATGMTNYNLTVNGNGSVIYSKATGKAAFDLLGSARYTVKDLLLIGDNTSTPTIGFQCGRVSSNTGGKANWYNVWTEGKFSVAAMYNFAGEVNTYNQVRLTNQYSTAEAYCLLQDSSNHQNITSDFITQTISQGTLQSFNENLFIGCEFRQLGSGIPIMMMGNAHYRHHYVNCYARTDNNVLIKTYNASDIRHLYLDIHGEAATLTKYLVIDNVNPSGTVSISNLTIRDHNPFPTSCLLDCTGSTQTVVMEATKFELGDLQNTIPVFGSTAGASKLKISGEIEWPSSKALDVSGAYFNGRISTKDTTTITHTLGSYDVIRRPESSTTRVAQTKGIIQVAGTGEGTDASNYIQLQGAAASGNVTLSSGGSDSNINIDITPKGTGNVNITAGSLGVNTAPSTKFHVKLNSSGNLLGTMEQSGTGDAGIQYLITGQTAWVTGVDNSDSDKFKISSANDSFASPHLTITKTTGSVIVGNTVLATNATDGFLYIPTCAGAPSGTPTAQTGTVPMIYDTTNNRIYVYNGAWKMIALL